MNKHKVKHHRKSETIITGGQTIRKAFAQCVGKLCKTFTFTCVYATSESMVCTQMRVHRLDAYEEFAMGYAPPGVELKIVNDDGEIVPKGEKGELHVKIDSMFKCYYNDPEKNKSMFHR